MKIAIVDYGAGNLPSVERALRKLGAETERAVEPEQVAAAKVIVLPGVGHFARIRRRVCANATSPSRCAPPTTPACRFSAFASACRRCSRRAKKRRASAGLGFFPDEVRALPTNVKSPHIGWNQVRRVQRKHAAARHSRRRLFLFRALLCRARFRRADGRGVRSRRFRSRP